MCGDHDLQYEDLRQCAVYGVGQMVLHAPAHVQPVLADILIRIMALIRAEGARDEDNNNATENAISTLGVCPRRVWCGNNLLLLGFFIFCVVLISTCVFDCAIPPVLC